MLCLSCYGCMNSECYMKKLVCEDIEKSWTEYQGRCWDGQ